jgi:glyoxylase-like metal-dependent hydrolase (beta-lactamase superfamily II)
MTPSQARHELRRRRYELEHSLFVAHGPDGHGAVPSSAQVEQRLRPLAQAVAESLRADELDRLDALAQAAASPSRRESYVRRYGVCGVRKYDSSGGAVLYQLPVETFPNHVNNLYLVHQGKDTPRLLFDVGSGTKGSQADLARAEEVLTRVYGEVEPWSAVRDVVVSHGHIDHFGGVGRWKRQGATLWMHELDVRVLTRFPERVVVASADVRRFVERAGVTPEERSRLMELYGETKDTFRPVAVDRVLADGQEVAGGHLAHHVPGHCPGQICLQVDDVLLTADHVLSRTTPHQAPEAITPYTGLRHYLDSLHKIARVPGVDLALGGHEEPMPRLAFRLAEIERFHRERLARVLSLCQGEPRTIAEVTELLFGPQLGYSRLLALEEAGAHVEYLDLAGALALANPEDFEHTANPVVRYVAAR